MKIILIFLNFIFPKEVDKVIALVNNEPIFYSEFKKNYDSLVETYKKVNNQELSDEKLQELKNNIVTQMISDKLTLQEAKKQKIKVTEKEIEAGIEEIKNRFKTDEDGNIRSDEEMERIFKNELIQQELTYEQFKTKVKEQIMVIKLIEKEIKTKIPIPTDEEIKKLFDIIKKRIEGKETEEIKSFKEEDIKDLNVLVKYFKDSAAQKVRARHILIKVSPNATLKDKEIAIKKIKDIKKQLDEGGDFSELAKKYSDDITTKDKGGDLGFFIQGWMPKSIEDAAFNLKVGEVSDIIESELGYHLIQVTESKASTKIKYEDIKNDLAQYLSQKKAKEKYEQWIESLKVKSKITINEF